MNVTDFKALGVDIPEREITGLSPILLPSPSKEFTKKPLFVPGFTGFLKEPMKNEDLERWGQGKIRKEKMRTRKDEERKRYENDEERKR